MARIPVECYYTTFFYSIVFLLRNSDVKVFCGGFGPKVVLFVLAMGKIDTERETSEYIAIYLLVYNIQLSNE